MFFFPYLTVYPCKQCGKIFYAASSLHSHKKRTHTSLENKFKCPHCVRFYAFQSELLRHIDTAHMPMSRSSNSALTNHVISPRSLGVNYSSQPVLPQPEIQSPTSSQPEEPKQELDTPLPVVVGTAPANHIKEEPTKKESDVPLDNSDEFRFKCHECGMLLKSRECLNLHINAKHTQKHAYPCSYCEKVFFAPSSRFCHVRRVHASAEQKFPCDYCPKLCTFHYELRNHIRLAHKGKAVPDAIMPDSSGSQETENKVKVTENNKVKVTENNKVKGQGQIPAGKAEIKEHG